MDGTDEAIGEMSAPDGGDEAQRRFRYQINYAALKGLQVLREGADVVAVYCEHVEDVLVEHSDGLLTGIQVKSRELDQNAFRSSNASVLSSLARFCVRDARYPGRFKQFILATNFVFFSGEGVEDLRQVLKRCRDNPKNEGCTSRDKIVAYLKRLATTAKVSVDAVVNTLARVALEERKTGIDQPDIELIHALGEFQDHRDRPWAELAAIARGLRAHVWDVSSLGLEGLILDAHGVVGDLDEHLDRLRTARDRKSVV